MKIKTDSNNEFSTKALNLALEHDIVLTKDMPKAAPAAASFAGQGLSQSTIPPTPVKLSAQTQQRSDWDSGQDNQSVYQAASAPGAQAEYKHHPAPQQAGHAHTATPLQNDTNEFTARPSMATNTAMPAGKPSLLAYVFSPLSTFTDKEEWLRRTFSQLGEVDTIGTGLPHCRITFKDWTDQTMKKKAIIDNGRGVDRALKLHLVDEAGVHCKEFIKFKMYSEKAAGTAAAQKTAYNPTQHYVHNARQNP